MAHWRTNRSERRRHSRKDQIQLLLRLEAKLERNDERIVHPRKDESLGECMGDLSSFDNVLFPDRFQRIYPPCIKFPHLQDLSQPKNAAQKKRSPPPTTSKRYSQWGWSWTGELAFPKLPFPITVISSKSSIPKGPYEV